ncbi:MAG: hypothetical protein QW789_04525, partial [Nitrososphaerota archaeon]
TKTPQIAICILLMLFFLLFSIWGHGSGLTGSNLLMNNLVRIEFEVFLINNNDKIEPVKDALVVVGSKHNITGESGRTSIMISPGSYSSYVKLADIKLAPYTDKLIITKNSKIVVTFLITKLYPNKFSVESNENFTIVRLTMNIKERYRAYISDPVLTLIRNNGTVIMVTAGPNGLGYFTDRITPNRPYEIVVKLNGAISYIDPQSSYIPLEIISVTKS